MTSTQGARRGNLAVLTGALFVVLWLAGDLAQSMGAGSDIAFPRPTDGMNVVQKWFDANGNAAATNAGIDMIAGIALLLFAGVAASLLRSLGRPGPAASVVGLAGATSAALLLVSTSSLIALGGTDASSNPAVAQALYQIGFYAGGPLHIATLGLTVAFLAGGLGGALPKWLSIAGIVIGVIGLLAMLSGVVSAFAAATLLGRYLGFLWILVVSVMFAIRAPSRAPAEQVEATA